VSEPDQAPHVPTKLGAEIGALFLWRVVLQAPDGKVLAFLHVAALDEARATEVALRFAHKKAGDVRVMTPAVLLVLDAIDRSSSEGRLLPAPSGERAG